MFKLQLGYETPLVLCPDWRLATAMGVARVQCLSSAQPCCCFSIGRSMAMSLTSPPRVPLPQAAPAEHPPLRTRLCFPHQNHHHLFAGTVTQLWTWGPWHARDQHTSKPLTSLAGRSGICTASTSTQSNHASTITPCQGTAPLCRGPAAPWLDRMSLE